PDETETFAVDNTPPPTPEGAAKTIGFWKNWTSCDGHGNQDDVLDQTLDAAGGSISLGGFAVTSCYDAVDLLDKRDIAESDAVRDGKKKGGDAAYGLAAQLLAAKLNLEANAGDCQEVLDTIDDADALLFNFTGTGNYWKGKNAGDDRALATELAGILDDYNNNLLCN
ncbi:MAG: hypothetical protein KJN77_08560, partial [Gammaproteobacteria bacterium]|nr:hypothetical protein [Gammaproteobacteria bacterium]